MTILSMHDSHLYGAALQVIEAIANRFNSLVQGSSAGVFRIGIIKPNTRDMCWHAVRLATLSLCFFYP